MRGRDGLTLTLSREKAYNLSGFLYISRSEEGSFLPEVIITSRDNFDHALKKFNKMVQQSGILAEARRRAHYEPPSVVRKKKAAAKRRKTMKNAQRS